MRLSRSLFSSALLSSGAFVSALPAFNVASQAKRADAGKLVTAHFMVGIVETYDQAAWEADMKLAASIGIDAFALNIGKDAYNDEQLGFAYAAAEATGFKVFISFDFAYWNAGDVNLIGEYIKKYDSSPGQLKYDGKHFVSSFVGDNFPWRAAESAAGVPLFACPNWQPGSFINGEADCGFSWSAWPNQGNQPINSNMTTDLDNEYITNLAGRPYMAPVSPWFFTHYGPDTYSKNWIFYSDYLWGARWEQILDMAPQFIEIITWNDFGESHYIGPLHPEDEHVYAGGPTGAVKWVRDMPHDGLRDVAAAYIKAFKAGEKSVTVEKDELVYYYRPSPKGAQCSDPVAPPNGADFDGDSVFVIAMLTAPGKVVITSGGSTTEIDAPAGVSTVSAAMGLGKQSFALTRDGSNVLSGDSALEISDKCEVNNFNIYVGTVVGGGGSPAPAPPAEDPTPAPTDPTPEPEPTDPESPPTEDPAPAPPTEEPAPPTEEPSPAPPTEEPAPAPPSEDPTPAPAPPAGDGNSQLVFSHFMIGIVSNRQSAADFDDDMKRAKAIGIDAFALNIGVDPYTDTQLGYAYESAANNDMKVFISFDFNWFKDASEAGRVGEMVKKYGVLPAQLKVDGKVFVSSFAGDALDVDTVRSTAGMDLYMAPNFHPGMGDFSKLDGALNWMGWPNDGNNKAPKNGKEVTVLEGDKTYLDALGSGKGLIAPVSPWFSTHFGSEVPYSKNWVFPGDLLWYNRWNEILTLKPTFIEIVTWNDYGESHYIGPLNSPHTDDGGSKWVNDMPHGGWLDMAIPFIKAYKAGSTDVKQYIDKDQVIYWYRRTPKDVNCDSTDTTMGPADNSTGNYFMGRPDGFEIMEDKVFIVPLLTAPGTVTVNSGGVLYTFDAPAGASSFSVDMGIGAQAFALTRDGKEVFSDTSLMPITDECPCGIYNFNAYVGTVPAQETDSLQTVALQMFSNGLKAACDPTPTFAAGQPPATVAPTSTVSVPGGSTAAPTPPPAEPTPAPEPPVTSEPAPAPPVTSDPAPAPEPPVTSDPSPEPPVTTTDAPAPGQTEAPSPPGPADPPPPTPPSNNTDEKLVFAHFMIGIVSNRQSAADFNDDMKRAKAIGIDAFALNIGVDPYTDTQLGYAYESAANNDMKVFISFDFNWYKDASEAGRVGEMVKKYGSLPAQLKVNGKVFVSSFAGDALDVDTVRSTSGMELYMAPNFHPGMGDFSKLDGALNWMGWPNDGNNKAPKAGKEVTVLEGDKAYLAELGAGKGLIAPVSPWFSTHFGSEVPYSKNWVFPGDLLWYNRWNEILTLQPTFIEIVTWNDYGESHYIGPLNSPHTDDGGSKWVNDMPHGGWLDMAIPFIKAYKAGSTDVKQYISEDQVIYWYRRTPKDVNCDSTDTTMGPADNSTGNYFMGRPDGFEIMEDKVFVVPLLTAPGTVTVNSGGTLFSFDAPAGASAFSVDMGIGAQAFALTRGGKEVFSDTSLMPITDECPCGIYNFNAYVGTVPAQEVDSLQTIALQMFSNGLKAACDPTPTLAAAQPPATVAPTSTVTVPGGSPADPGPTSPPSTPPADDPPVTTTSTTSASEPSETPTETCNTLAAPTLHAPRRRRVLSFGRFHIEIDDE